METAETAPKLPDAYHDSRLLSYPEVGKMLGLSKMTILRLTQNKNDPLPSFRIGRARKFKLDQLLWWIEKHAI